MTAVPRPVRRVALDAMPNPMVAVDRDRRIVEWNDAAARLYGYGRREVIGKAISDLLWFPEDIAEFEGRRDSNLADGNAWRDNLRHRHKDGSEIWVSVAITPVIDPVTGEFDGNIGLISDRRAEHSREALERDRSSILEMLAWGDQLQSVLEAIARTAERHVDDIRCAILTVAGDENRFGLVASPTLDHRYGDALIGASTGMLQTPCALAAVSNAPVYVKDIEQDPRWEACRPLARLWGLRSCWSTPVLDRDRHAVATFAIYSTRPRLPSVETLAVIESLTHLVGIAVAREREAGALRESEQRRAEVHALMIRAEQTERARIAGDLHDDTVQVLAATLITLDRLLSAPLVEARRGVLLRARESLALAQERTRHLMFALRPQLLDARGLEAAVSELARRVAGECSFDITVTVVPDRYAEEVEALCFRVVAEALTNIRKHANAANVVVDIQDQDGTLSCLVSDDGRGFDTNRPLAPVGFNIGLETMRERVLLADGSFDVESNPQQGTVVRFTIPASAPPETATARRPLPSAA
jgi:PAS domain S-box-containing protein